jgi:hypothetical protein
MNYLEKIHWDVNDDTNAVKDFLNVDSLKKIKKIVKITLFELGYLWKDYQIYHLGFGSFGHAFLVKNDNEKFVLKFTSDINEYKNAKLLIGKNLNYISNYYKAVKLDLKSKTFFNTYAITLEYLETPKKYLSDDLFYLIDTFVVFKLKNPDLEFDEYYDERNFAHLSEDQYYDLCYDLEKISEEAKKYNIKIKDLHSANVGYKKNHLAWFDVGFTSENNFEYNDKPIKINIY